MSRAVDLESDPSCVRRPSVLYVDSHIARPGERGNRRRRRSNRPGNSQAKGPAGATALRRATPRARAGPPKEQAAGPRRFRGETLRSSTEGARRARAARGGRHDAHRRAGRRDHRRDHCLSSSRRGVRRDGGGPPPLPRHGDELRQRGAALRLERRGLDELEDGAERAEVDTAARRAAPGPPASALAQGVLDGRVPGQPRQLPREHDGDGADGHGPRARSCRRWRRGPGWTTTARRPGSCTSTPPSGRWRTRVTSRRSTREAGLDRRELSAQEVLRIEPRLATRPAGGFWTPCDATGDIHRFTKGVARWLEGQGMAFEMEREGARGPRDGSRRGDRRGPLRRRRGLRRGGLAGDRPAARRPGERLSGEGLLDHRDARRRGLAGGGRRACRSSTTRPRS